MGGAFALPDFFVRCKNENRNNSNEKQGTFLGQRRTPPPAPQRVGQKRQMCYDNHDKPKHRRYPVHGYDNDACAEQSLQARIRQREHRKPV